MPAWRSGLAHGVLNAALVVMGFVVMVLLYALVTRTLTPRIDPLRATPSATLVGDFIQVEVRNGVGTSGLAATVTQHLRKQGFDVVQAGNHDAFDVAHSMVIDRAGDLASARQVAAALGIPPERVRQELRPSLYLDASVILGHDYVQLYPFGGEGAAAPPAR
jgi:hypothetical protein